MLPFRAGKVGARLNARPTLRYVSDTAHDRKPHTESPTSAIIPPRPSIYRDLWPSILSCLGVGFVVYYGLELWRTNLDYKWQARDFAIEVEGLKAEVERLRATAESTRSGLPSESKSKDEKSRKKWLGLF